MKRDLLATVADRGTMAGGCPLTPRGKTMSLAEMHGLIGDPLVKPVGKTVDINPAFLTAWQRA